MNKSKLIWGIICLLIAGGLAAANLLQSPDQYTLIFMIGNINMPWVPPIVLGILGIVLLSTMHLRDQEEKPAEVEIDSEKSTLNKRLETIAWGVFLIMLGGFLFVPQEIIRGGWWSIGIGLIFLGLNGARYFTGLRMSGFTTFLGVLSVIGGILDLVGLPEVNGAILFIVLGLYLILKPSLDKRQLFGKPDQA